MRSLALVALVLISITSIGALEISLLGRVLEFGRMGRFDIYARNMRGVYIEHTDFGTDGYVETFQIPYNRHAYSVYYAEECIARNLDRIRTVYYYKWAEKTLCRINSVNDTNVHAIRSEGGWLRVDEIEFREADAEFAPGVIVNIDGPCVDVPGLKCQRYVERKIFTPVEHCNIHAVVDSRGHELFNLTESKRKRVVSVSVAKSVEGNCCVMEAVDEFEEAENIYMIIQEGEMLEMTPEQVEQWKVGTAVATVKNAVQKTRAVLGFVLIPIYKICTFPFSALWRFANGPPPAPPRSSILVPCDIKGNGTKTAMMSTVVLAMHHIKRTFHPSQGYLFNPIMYGKRYLWANENEYVYRVEILEHSLYKVVRLDIFVSHRQTYCKFYHINDDDAHTFIDHTLYLVKYVRLHRECSLEADIDAMRKYDSNHFRRHEMYHSVVDDERRVVSVSGFDMTLWKIQGDGTMLVATSMLAGVGRHDLTYFWITLRDFKGSFRYVTYVYDDVEEELYPCELVPDIVLAARELLARATAKCDTEYSLMLKLEKCVALYYTEDVPGYNRVPSAEEGEVIVVEEPPYKTVFTNGHVGTAGLKPGAWNTSAVYHNLILHSHFMNFVYTENGESFVSRYQYCCTRYFATTVKAYRVFKQDYQIPVNYDVRENNKAIVWVPMQGKNALYGTAAPGYFINCVYSASGKIWSFKSDFQEVFHHIEAIQLLLWVRFDVYIIDEKGRVYRDMDAPWHNEEYMNYYHGGWLDAPKD